MKFVVALLLFTLLALAAWPYLYLYRLDRAVADRDMSTLAELVDIASVRREIKKTIEQRDAALSKSRSRSFLGWIQEGIRQIGGRAVDISVDLEWVYSTLNDRDGDPDTTDPSILSATTYAFFESYDKFLIRVGELGAEPLHIRMTLENGRWRVTGIYD